MFAVIKSIHIRCLTRKACQVLTSESDDSEWNYISASPNIKRNFQEEVEDLSVLASGEADEEDAVIPYVDEPLASQEFT